jgi:tRNA1Val (adenine37-N6)-methyltransferase
MPAVLPGAHPVWVGALAGALIGAMVGAWGIGWRIGWRPMILSAALPQAAGQVWWTEQMTDAANAESTEAGFPVTTGQLLDGRVRYAQPREGFRSGIEPVFLAASVPARSGQRVLEAGTGAGAAMLCLAARVPGVAGLGVEQDAGLAMLAARNAAANEMAGLTFLAADITAAGDLGLFDHAMANPPYHDAAGTASPLAARVIAKQAPAGLLAEWARASGSRLRHHGTLSFILPAAILPACLEAFASADCAASAVLPLWPKAERNAKLVLVRGVKSGRGPMRLLPGLVLHAGDGGYTPAAQAVLRAGMALDLNA